MEVVGDEQYEFEQEPRYPTLPMEDDRDDWTYTMRRSMQEIIPGLFLGPYAAATRNSLEAMKAAGLTHVVCIRSNIEAHLIRANHMDHFQYLLVQMDDSPLESIIPKIKAVSTFIDNCLNNGGKVLVHGNAGLSRSAAIVVGYIMSKYGVTFKKANRYVQSKRFCISLNETFTQQLKEYEPIYQAMHSVPKLLPGESGDGFCANEMLKRKLDCMIDDEDDEEGGVRPRIDQDSMDSMDTV